MNHKNSGSCELCHEIMDRYEGIDYNLKSWFISLQAMHPEAHISEAGRGKAKQEKMLEDGKSRAKFGESAHNFNCAVDIFVNKRGLYIYDKHWFETVLAPKIPTWLTWYGAPGSKFYELPHIEISNWRDLRDKDLVWLVEEEHEA